MIEQTVMDFILQHGQWSVLIGSFFFGESVIISAGFLSATGVWPLPNVYVLALVGTVLSDSLWFLCGHLLMNKTMRARQSSERYQRMVAKIERVTGNKPFLVLLFIKFLYGTRILTIVYLAHQKMRFVTFLLFDTIGTMVWLVVMLGVGWLAGRGIINLLPQVKHFEYAFTVLIVVAIASKLVSVWLNARKK